MECRITAKVGVIIVAGGKGVRMGGDLPKQFRVLGQAPILVHTINAFARAVKAAQIVVVLPESHIDFWRNLASRFEVADHRVVAGGSERFYSVKSGLDSLDEQIDIVAVHDGVRPLCSVELIERCVESATKCGSAIPVTSVIDTVRLIGDQGSSIIDRSTLRAVQTPQVFDSVLLRRAYRQEFKESFTDDASVVEAMGHAVELCEGERRNIKITTNEDLLYAQMILDSDNEREEL